jgi:hypothetical protein
MSVAKLMVEMEVVDMKLSVVLLLTWPFGGVRVASVGLRNEGQMPFDDDCNLVASSGRLGKLLYCFNF